MGKSYEDYMQSVADDFDSQLEQSIEDNKKMKENASYFTSLNVKVSKAQIGIRNGKTMEFPFNPEQFREISGADYVPTGGAGSSYLFPQFTRGRMSELVIEDIYLNARTEGHDIKGFIKHLHTLLPPKDRSQFVHAPDTIIAYGGDYIRICKLVDMEVDYTMFNNKLEPIEAKINLNLLIVEHKWGVR